MRLSIVCGALLALAGSAQAKYHPCNHHGSSTLVPSGPVPRNAKVWLAYRLAGSYRLTGGEGDRIITPPDGSSTVFDLGSLAADETYELFAEADGGEWKVATFTTSSDEDHAAPRAPVIRSLAIAHTSDHRHAAEGDPPNRPEWFDTPANDIAIDLDLSGDTVFLDVAVSEALSGSVFHRVLWREDLALLGRTACLELGHLRAGATACLSIRAIDLAGNRSEPVTRCSSVVERAGDPVRILRSLSAFPRTPRRGPRPWTPRFVISLASSLALLGCALAIYRRSCAAAV